MLTLPRHMFIISTIQECSFRLLIDPDNFSATVVMHANLIAKEFAECDGIFSLALCPSKLNY